MKIPLIAIPLLAFAANVNAQGLGYKGTPFGATKEELIARHPGLKCEDPGQRFRILGDEMCEPELTSANVENLPAFGTYAGQRVRRPSFGIVGGRFASFRAGITPDQYEAVRDAVTAGIGPGVETSRALQTRGGATVQSRTFTVRRQEGSITLLEHAGTIAEGAVAGSSTEYEAFRQKLEADTTKAGSKDL